MELEFLFPNLVLDGYRITSPETTAYNCIAWAAELQDDWWWPDSRGLHFWPAGIPRLETIEAFLAAFALLGYFQCFSHQQEDGYQKIAIYCLDGKPQHAARQIPTGLWSSKLGKFVDIEHSLRGLEGLLYGAAAIFLKRPIKVS